MFLFLGVDMRCCVFLEPLRGRLDEQGRQVDAEGKLVRQGPVLTLKANRLGSQAHNPYLQHTAVRSFRIFLLR